MSERIIVVVPIRSLRHGKTRLSQVLGNEARETLLRGIAVRVVTAAIALWNTVYLGRALDALRRQGEAVPGALLAHLAPVGWRHINLTGDYLWDTDASLAPDGFRALRDSSPALADAA